MNQIVISIDQNLVLKCMFRVVTINDNLSCQGSTTYLIHQWTSFSTWNMIGVKSSQISHRYSQAKCYTSPSVTVTIRNLEVHLQHRNHNLILCSP